MIIYLYIYWVAEFVNLYWCPVLSFNESVLHLSPSQAAFCFICNSALVNYVIEISTVQWWNLHLTNIFFVYIFEPPQGKYEQEYEQSGEFQQQLKLKVRELLTDQEWRRRKMQMRVCCITVRSDWVNFVYSQLTYLVCF